MAEFDPILYEKLPDQYRDGMRRYVEHGTQPGHFLTAVLENNLHAAVSRADDVGTRHLREIVGWCWWELPAPAWGSRDKVTAWIDARRAPRAAGDDGGAAAVLAEDDRDRDALARDRAGA